MVVNPSGDVVADLVEAIFGEVFLAPGQVQEILGVSYAKLNSLINAGDIPAFGSDKRNVFKPRHIARFMMGEPSLTEKEKQELFGEQ